MRTGYPYDAKTIARFWSKVDKNGPVPAHVPGIGNCWVWTASLENHGYGQLNVKTATGWRPMRAHRIAYEIEHGPIPDNLCVTHKCDNPSCCRPSHLVAGTHRFNMRDCISKGRFRFQHGYGQHLPSPKLNPDKVVEIRRLFTAGASVIKLAKMFGVSTRSINAAAFGNSWPHVPHPSKRRGPTIGERNGCAKLKSSDVVAIRSAAGSLRQIAARFNIGISTVSQIKNRRRWKHIK